MRRSRLITAAALAAAASITLSACAGGGSGSDGGSGGASGEPVDGGTLVYATDVQPAAGGLDPYIAAAFANQNIIVQIYDTLLTKSADGEIEPGLAESWEQIDDTTYQMTLRDGVEFSDGTALTADDVVFSFDTMTTTGAPQATLLTGLTSTTAIDDTTVEFKLASANGAFINLVAARGNTYIVNKAWYESTPPEDRQRSALGTGPFALDSWVDNVSIDLVKNENYWQEGLPHLDGLQFQILPDETARVSTLRQGAGVDAAWLRDVTLAEPLESEGFTVGQNAATRGINLYVNAQSGPLADVRVRQAISLAMDRSEIVDLAVGGAGEVSLTVPVGDPSSVTPDDSTPNYTRDVDAAKELLAEAGMENPTITLTYGSDASFALDVPAYEVMKEQLAEAGITLQLEGKAWADLVGSFIGGTYTGLIAVPGTYQADMTSYFTTFLAPGAPTNKVTVAGDPGTAELGELFALTDETERSAKLAEVEDIVAENAYMYVLYAQPQRYEVWSSDVQGYEVDPYTYRSNLVNAWLAN